MYKEYDQEKIK